ncbi:MAG: ankyrin repeat domain-containing protein [Bacteroidota bacterium]
MIQPNEMKNGFAMHLHNEVVSTNTKVWEILAASKNGDLASIKKMADDCPELLYAQYNYTPAIHFAVREGHSELVTYLLGKGAHDPSYKMYPFQDSLETIAEDRGYLEIAKQLKDYAADSSIKKYTGDNGGIDFNYIPSQQEFQYAVNHDDIAAAEKILKQHPEYALDDTYSWGEGILMMPAQHKNYQLLELLMQYGAKVPVILKWTQAYYFKFYEPAAFMMEKGMYPNTMSWQQVTILHDMAQKGFLDKADLLIKYGAELDPIDDEYQSTPLGMAARWGHIEMVDLLLSHGANPGRSGAAWSTPLAWAKKKGYTEIVDRLLKAGAQ